MSCVLRGLQILAVVFSMAAGLIGCSSERAPSESALRPGFPACGLVSDLEFSKLAPLRAEPQRFTPHQPNGFIDDTRLMASPGEPGEYHFAVVDPVTCRALRHLAARPDPATQGQIEATWDGRDADGLLADPGQYLIWLRSGGVDAEPGTADAVPTLADSGPWLRSVIVGQLDSPCLLPDAEIDVSFQQTFEPADTPQEIEIPLPSGQHQLCGELRLTAGSDGTKPAVGFEVNGDVLFAPGEIAEPGIVRIPFIKDDGSGLAKVMLQKGGLHLVLGAPPFDFGALPDVEREDILCEGQLYGFRHPFHVQSPASRMRRSGIRVMCEATFSGVIGIVSPSIAPIIPSETTPSIHADRPIEVREVVRVFTETLPDGSFSAVIPAALQNEKIRTTLPLQSVRANCSSHEDCGPTLKAVSLDPHNPSDLGIYNVVDFGVNGFTARLISNSWNSVTRHDLPLIIQEPFDPLRQDDSRNIVWLMSGQPTDLALRNGSGVATPGEACTAPIKGPCLGPRQGCQWTPSCSTGDGSVICSGANVLGPLLDAGYDIWMIDDRRRDERVMEQAQRLPELYQRILDYPEPRPQRNAAILGLSTGAVTARAALKLWDVKAQIEDGTAREQFPGFPEIEWNAEGFGATPSRIRLFVSFDAPHRGAFFPEALEAYFKDPGFTPEDEVPLSRIPELLNSGTARELLVNHIATTRLPKTMCFGKPPECDISPPLDILKNSVESGRLERTSIIQLSQIAGDTPPFTGLPSVKSIAVANGALSAPAPYASDIVARATIDLGPRNVHHTIRQDVNQPAGSTLASLCTAGELLGPTGEFANGIEQAGLALRCDQLLNAGSSIIKKALGIGGFAACIIVAAPAHPFVDPTEAIVRNLQIPEPFPTFVPTYSALLINAPRTTMEVAAEDIPTDWADALWQDENRSHFNVGEDHCKGLLYHLDGNMKGNLDGIPYCPNREALGASCAEGGRLVGQLLDPERAFPSQTTDDFCDDGDGPTMVDIEVNLHSGIGFLK